MAVPLDERDSTESDAAGKEARECGVWLPRGVAGTTVCVDVVESDEDEDELDGAGEMLRGEAGVPVKGVDDILGGVRDVCALSYASCRDLLIY